jgi:CheY-like chemotaxis protein
VDDEIELTTLFKEFLRKEGYNAIAFSDPVMALEYFEETSGKHSMIITDQRMPIMSGIDLAKRIRESDNDIKIFLMTAFDAKDLVNNENFKAARIDKLIQKPIRFADLRVMISEAWKK